MMENCKRTSFLLASLSIYRPLKEKPLFALLESLLKEKMDSPEMALDTYARFYQLLAESPFPGNWADCLFHAILYSDNLFTRACARGEKVPPFVETAVQRDFQIFAELFSLTSQQLKEYLGGQFPDQKEWFAALPDFDSTPVAYTQRLSADMAAEFVQKYGFGIFAQYHSFFLDVKQDNTLSLEPISHPDDIRLSDLKGYKKERKIILDNTLAMLEGAKANNILLYGDRGTGKSSTVKAILNEYADRGLRLIEISKYNLKYLGALAERLCDNPHKFILFTDDLTFQENDDSYAAMKAVLDGSSRKLSDNMVIYATSNRRHLIRETFSSREGDEIHLADTRDEAASLSDRFGITVTFLSPNRQKFNEIVLLLAKDKGIEVEEGKLLQQANIWASRKANFSPRCARQFIDHVYSQTSRGLPFEW